ncbi:MAG: flagellar motor switch protein FliG [Spirochaetaceae bacterium]|jgi:flagellar motor switch protein FliG|nr:flagellar motor switch protein FliG [Spirochaetaceae bacterium]
MNENEKRGRAAYKKTLSKAKDKARAAPEARLIKTPDAPPAAAAPPAPPPAKSDGAKSESKHRRVAKFLILTGAEEASKILTHLETDQVERITQEIAAIRGIPPDEAARILEEFADLLSGAYSRGGAARGGADEARKLLYAAFGSEKGEAFLRRAVPGSDETPFSFLEDFSGEQLSLLLRDESPATGALILSRIAPALSAAVLSAGEAAWRKETVRRIGRLGRVSPEVLAQVAQSLREKARRLGSAATSDVNGKETLAAILKHTDLAVGDKILSDLSHTDADLSRDVKELLHTLDDVVKAEDRPIQEKLHTMSVAEIATLIKGRPAAFAEKILSNVSAHRRVEVRVESDLIGPITKKDAEAAIKAFMEWFRSGREDGSIIMIDDELVE